MWEEESLLLAHCASDVTFSLFPAKWGENWYALLYLEW